jgi:hypothetical protein
MEESLQNGRNSSLLSEAMGKQSSRTFLAPGCGLQNSAAVRKGKTLVDADQGRHVFK